MDSSQGNKNPPLHEQEPYHSDGWDRDLRTLREIEAYLASKPIKPKLPTVSAAHKCNKNCMAFEQQRRTTSTTSAGGFFNIGSSMNKFCQTIVHTNVDTHFSVIPYTRDEKQQCYHNSRRKALSSKNFTRGLSGEVLVHSLKETRDAVPVPVWAPALKSRVIPVTKEIKKSSNSDEYKMVNLRTHLAQKYEVVARKKKGTFQSLKINFMMNLTPPKNLATAVESSQGAVSESSQLDLNCKTIEISVPTENAFAALQEQEVEKAESTSVKLVEIKSEPLEQSEVKKIPTVIDEDKSFTPVVTRPKKDKKKPEKVEIPVVIKKDKRRLVKDKEIKKVTETAIQLAAKYAPKSTYVDAPEPAPKWVKPETSIDTSKPVTWPKKKSVVVEEEEGFIPLTKAEKATLKPESILKVNRKYPITPEILLNRTLLAEVQMSRNVALKEAYKTSQRSKQYAASKIEYKPRTWRLWANVKVNADHYLGYPMIHISDCVTDYEDDCPSNKLSPQELAQGFGVLYITPVYIPTYDWHSSKIVAPTSAKTTKEAKKAKIQAAIKETVESIPSPKVEEKVKTALVEKVVSAPPKSTGAIPKVSTPKQKPALKKCQTDPKARPLPQIRKVVEESSDEEYSLPKEVVLTPEHAVDKTQEWETVTVYVHKDIADLFAQRLYLVEKKKQGFWSVPCSQEVLSTPLPAPICVEAQATELIPDDCVSVLSETDRLSEAAAFAEDPELEEALARSIEEVTITQVTCEKAVVHRPIANSRAEAKDKTVVHPIATMIPLSSVFENAKDYVPVQIRVPKKYASSIRSEKIAVVMASSPKIVEDHH